MKKLALLVTVLFLLGVCVAWADTFGPHEVSFLGVSYDTPETGQSSWTYKVTSGSGPALSHFTLELCLPANVLSW